MLAVIVQGNFQQASKTIQKANACADLIEFRLDLMERYDHDYIGKLLKQCRLPTIFTLRRKEHGGSFYGNEKDRKDIILHLLTLSPTYIDLEYDVTFRDKIPSNIRIISSYHNFKHTPCDIQGIYEKMQESKGDIYKISCYANTTLDSLRMLQFVSRNKNISGMCMGKYGRITRILAPVVGNAITYVPVSKKEGTFRGQIDLDELLETYHFDKLNQDTKIYGLIGNPVDKSISHLSHNKIFREFNKNAVYVKLVVKPQELSLFFSLCNTLPFEGLSVTMPLKYHVAPYLNKVDQEAKEIGAINTLKKDTGLWYGYNTDGKGALDAIERKGAISGKTLLILGAGGAAQALSYEGFQRGAQIIIANRTKSKAQHLAKKIKGKGIGFNELSSVKYDVLINTIPITIDSTKGSLPINYEFIFQNSIVFDAIYNPVETPLLTVAKSKGCRVVFGYEMFIEQAIGQLKEWFVPFLDDQKISRIIKSCAFI